MVIILTFHKGKPRLESLFKPRSWNQPLNPDCPTAEPVRSTPKFSPYACPQISRWMTWSSFHLPLPGNTNFFWKHYGDRLSLIPGRVSCEYRGPEEGVYLPLSHQAGLMQC